MHAGTVTACAVLFCSDDDADDEGFAKTMALEALQALLAFATPALLESRGAGELKNTNGSLNLRSYTNET